MDYEVGRRQAAHRARVEATDAARPGGAPRVEGDGLATLFRMSYLDVCESGDLGAGIFDVDGRSLCERLTPMHIGSPPWYIRGMHTLAGEVDDGDVSSTTTVLGASHTPDRRSRC
jgi:hypothetical protein